MTPHALAWFDRLTWILIYGGLFGIVLGVATHGAHLIAGWSLGVVGGAAFAAGVVLIWVRSRLPPSAGSGAESSNHMQGKP